MKIEEILAQPAKVLTRKQREFYFDNGYLLLPEFISAEWLRRLQTVTAAFIDESRTVTASNEKYCKTGSHRPRSSDRCRPWSWVDPQYP
jgi:hypothetical protein